MKYPDVRNFIGVELVEYSGGHADVSSPLDGSVLSSVPLSTATEVDRAVQCASKAFSDWSSRTIKERAQIALLSVTTFWTFCARTRHLGSAAMESGDS
jgi:malonate-semialdehyde dehydrogenase (acetylating)/methylmalonate-semialdehyde dehydrogenase